MEIKEVIYNINDELLYVSDFIVITNIVSKCTHGKIDISKYQGQNSFFNNLFEANQ